METFIGKRGLTLLFLISILFVFTDFLRSGNIEFYKIAPNSTYGDLEFVPSHNFECFLNRNCAITATKGESFSIYFKTYQEFEDKNSKDGDLQNNDKNQSQPDKIDFFHFAPKPEHRFDAAARELKETIRETEQLAEKEIRKFLSIPEYIEIKTRFEDGKITTKFIYRIK